MFPKFIPPSKPPVTDVQQYDKSIQVFVNKKYCVGRGVGDRKAIMLHRYSACDLHTCHPNDIYIYGLPLDTRNS